MPRNIDLTEAEWTLMEQLWGAPGQTGRALTDALHAETGWARSTTLTLLRRLTEKGAVRTEEQDGMHVYFPAVSREDAAARQTREALVGMHLPCLDYFMAHFLDAFQLTLDELE